MIPLLEKDLNYNIQVVRLTIKQNSPITNASIVYDMDGNIIQDAEEPSLNTTTVAPAQLTTAPLMEPTFAPTEAPMPGVTCADDTCLNGADCVDMDDGVHCFCQDGFEGARCEISKIYQIIINGHKIC